MWPRWRARLEHGWRTQLSWMMSVCGWPNISLVGRRGIYSSHFKISKFNRELIQISAAQWWCHPLKARSAWPGKTQNCWAGSWKMDRWYWDRRVNGLVILGQTGSINWLNWDRQGQWTGYTGQRGSMQGKLFTMDHWQFIRADVLLVFHQVVLWKSIKASPPSRTAAVNL